MFIQCNTLEPYLHFYSIGGISINRAFHENSYKSMLFIDNYLPIQAISAEAQMESSVTQAKGYLSKALLSILHRWWARRPLVACRAAVYAALVPADQFRPANGPEEKRTSLARANAAKFLERLCRREVLRKD